MKGKNRIWLFVGLSVLVIGVVAALALTRDRGEESWTANTRPPVIGETIQLSTEEGNSPTEIPLKGVEETQSLIAELTESLPMIQTTEGTAESLGGKTEQGEGATEPVESKTEPTDHEPEPTQATAPVVVEAPALKLPYSIPGTSLVVGRLDRYEGAFLEQGTDVTMENVAMILLTNTGEEALEYGIITITMEDDTVLVFEPTCLPAGGKMVVQESTGKAFPGGDMVHCLGETATLPELPMSQEQIKVTENEDSSITITNITNQTIPGVRVFYKLYMEEDEGFVGGITYMAKATNLAPGASVTVRPSHYLYGSCKVVMVRTYDTAD